MKKIIISIIIVLMPVILFIYLIGTNNPNLEFKSNQFNVLVDVVKNNIQAKIESAGSGIQFIMPAQASSTYAKGDVKGYNISDNTAVEYQVKKDGKQKGIKETIVLKDLSSPTEFIFQTNLENIARYEPGLDDTRAWRFFNKEGKEVFFIPKGFMSDANGQKSNAVTITLENCSINTSAPTNTCLVRVSADKTWLGNAAYPVKIDPSVILSGGFTDVEAARGGQQRKIVAVSTSALIAGSAVKIGSSLGTLPGTGREVVRTTGGTLYAFINNAGTCEMFKSTDGTSWAEVDAAHHPTCASGKGVAMAIDSTDKLQFVYYVSSTSFTYNTMPTTGGSADTYGTSEGVFLGVTPTTIMLDIAVDSNDIPHTVEFYTLSGQTVLNYKNRIGGSWSKSINVYSVGSGPNTNLAANIAIDKDNFPEVGYFQPTATIGTYTGVGSANNPASFTTFNIDSSVNTTAGTLGAAIAVDSSGNSWFTYVDATGTNQIDLIKHNYGDAWGTWQTMVTDSKTGKAPSIALNGSDVYVFYQNSADDVAYDKYNGASWSGEQTLQTGTYQTIHTKWSFLDNNKSSSQLDYLFSDGTDVYWAKLAFGTAGSAWYAFYSDASSVFYKKSSDGVTWGSAVTLDSTNVPFAPSAFFAFNGKIYVAWLRDTGDAIAMNTIDTNNSDALGTQCTSSDLGTFDSTTTSDAPSIAVSSNGTIYIATGGGTTASVQKLTIPSCTFTDITSGSGLGTNDFPALATIGTKLHMVYQDGNLSHSIYDGSSWTTSNTTIDTVLDTVFSLTTDTLTNLWLLAVNSNHDSTDFYKYNGSSWSSQLSPWSSTQSLAPTTFTSNITSEVWSVKVDSNTVAMVYEDASASNVGKLAVYNTVTGAQNVAPTAFSGSDSVAIISADMVDSDSIIIAYQDSAASNVGKFVIYNTSTGSQEVGPTTFSGTDAIDMVSVAMIDSNSVAIAYRDTTAGFIGKFVVYSTTGPAPTTQEVAPTTFAAGGINTVSAVKVDSNTVAITYSDAGDSNKGKFATYNATTGAQILATTTFTTNSISNATFRDNSAAMIDADSIAIAYQDSSNSNKGTFVINNTTTGTQELAPTVFSGSDGINFPALSKITSSSVAIAYEDTTNSSLCTYAAYNTSGTQILAPTTVSGNGTDWVSASMLDTNLFAIVYRDTSDTDKGKFTVYAVSPTGISNLTAASITWDSVNNLLFAYSLHDNSQQAYFKRSTSSNIGWSSESSLNFRMGDLGQLSTPLISSGSGQLGAVTRETENFKFSQSQIAPPRIKGNVRIKGSIRFK